MFRFMTVLAALLLLTAQAAVAQDEVLSHAQPQAEAFEHIEMNAHSVWFTGTSADQWFVNGVSFYGRRYGDVGDLIGSIVIFGPQTDKTRRIEDMPDSNVVYSTTLFNLSDVPETADWFYVPVELIELPTEGFRVAIYTRSNDERGIEIGLGRSDDDNTNSSEFRVLTADEFDDDSISGITVRRDNRDWMIRTHVSYTSGLGSGIQSSDISGASFGYHDDGTADGWEEFRNNGAMVRFDNSSERTVDAVYIYAMLGEDWFGTDRTASVTLMDDRFNIIKRSAIPYLAFNEVGSWAMLELPDIEVSGTFYVIIQPHSEKQVKFLLGVDGSGNKASSVGTIGAPLDWRADSSEADSNWMVRVHYSD